MPFEIITHHFYYFVTVFTVCYSVAFIFYLSSRFQYSKPARTFALLLLSIIFWSIKDSLGAVILPYFGEILFERVLVLLSPLYLVIPLFGFYMLVSVYNAAMPTERRFKYGRRVLAASAILISLIFIAALFYPSVLYTNLMMTDTDYTFTPGIGMVIFSLLLGVIGGVPAALLLVNTIKNPKSEGFFIGIGSLVTVAIVMVFNIAPTVVGLNQIPRVGCLSAFILAFSAWYGISRYGHIFPLARILEEREKSRMIVSGMEALLEVQKAEALYQRIGDYACEISQSCFACIVFFKRARNAYEVQSVSCEQGLSPQSLQDCLPLRPQHDYELTQAIALKQVLETAKTREYNSLEAFFGASIANHQAEIQALPCSVRQIICYPIILDKEIHGAIILFREEPTQNVEYFSIFPTQCAMVLRFSSQIRELEEKRRLEDQLHQAQKMEAIGQLAGGIAHDFNNMLSGITGYANLIKRKFAVDKPELKSFVDAITTAATRASDLTSKLLAYARKGKYQTIAIDMHACLQEVISLLEHTFDKRIRISRRLQAKPSSIMGDPTQMQNMILNLSLNARDAMASGGDLIFKTETIVLNAGLSMDGQYEIGAGTYLVLSVIDTGVGMDEATKRRLFEPFFTTKDIGKGTGLGLASVYGTVKSHGGFIVVESEPGQGATFRIYLPLARTEAPKQDLQKTELIIRGHGNILVVDDEEMIRNLTKEILVFLGYTVQTCKDGPEAVAYFSRHGAEVDLVILDVIMPKMDGYETFRELSKIRPDIKVIITTGYSLKDDTSILNTGVAGFIQKPFESGALSQLVHNVMTGKKTKAF